MFVMCLNSRCEQIWNYEGKATTEEKISCPRCSRPFVYGLGVLKYRERREDKTLRIKPIKEGVESIELQKIVFKEGAEIYVPVSQQDFIKALSDAIKPKSESLPQPVDLGQESGAGKGNRMILAVPLSKSTPQQENPQNQAPEGSKAPVEPELKDREAGNKPLKKAVEVLETGDPEEIIIEEIFDETETKIVDLRQNQ